MTTTAWKPITAAAVIAFLLGTGFGSWQVQRRFFCIPKYSAEQKKEKLLARFVSELKLTADQTKRVEQILNTKTERMEALRAEVRPRFKTIRTEMKQEISAILTAEQRVRFEAMEREWEARKKNWRPD